MAADVRIFKVQTARALLIEQHQCVWHDCSACARLMPKMYCVDVLNHVWYALLYTGHSMTYIKHPTFARADLVQANCPMPLEFLGSKRRLRFQVANSSCCSSLGQQEDRRVTFGLVVTITSDYYNTVSVGFYVDCSFLNAV